MNKFWLTLVVISSGITIWFASIAMMGLWKYSRLDSRAIAKVLEWRVNQKSSSQFAIEATYLFKVSDTSYESKIIFTKPYFLNEPSAQYAIKEIKDKPWAAWYNKKNPKVSSLQKIFPFQACIQAFLTLCVSLYFVFLRGFFSRLAF